MEILRQATTKTSPTAKTDDNYSKTHSSHKAIIGQDISSPLFGSLSETECDNNNNILPSWLNSSQSKYMYYCENDNFLGYIIIISITAVKIVTFSIYKYLHSFSFLINQTKGLKLPTCMYF